MKKYCAALLSLLLISALLLTGCTVTINSQQTDPSTEGTTPGTSQEIGSDDNFTTDMDVLIDIIPSDPTEEEETTEATTEATEEATNGDNATPTTIPTEPVDTEPTEEEEKPTEPTPPSPTNSSGAIELPMIPG